MQNMAAAEAKNHFGVLLDTVQREPVSISKKGRMVAVVISVDEYETHKTWKLEALQRELQTGINEAKRGEVIDGEAVFAELCPDDH